MAGQRPGSDAEGLIELIDRLEGLLNESEISEIEIEAGQTALVVKKPWALPAMQFATTAAAANQAASETSATQAAADESAVPTSGGHAVVAPLTGLYYGSPSPDAEPYVKEGGPVSVGQVIGLIEAMKLFNEIKSDLAGRVLRICVENGALVKAKQTLIEIEPT